MGRNSSVGIATRYGLDGPGIDSSYWGEIFRNRPDRSLGPPSLLYRVGKVAVGGGGGADNHLLPPRFRKRLNYTSATSTCLQRRVSGEIYLAPLKLFRYYINFVYLKVCPSTLPFLFNSPGFYVGHAHNVVCFQLAQCVVNSL